LLRGLPEPAGRGFCIAIGRAAHFAVGRDRHLARKNLARVYPEWPADRIRRSAKGVFEELGRSVYDFIRYPDLSEEERDQLVAIEGLDHLKTALAGGRGAILVTGHLGSWEIMGAHLTRIGLPLRSLARPLREPRLDRQLNRHRRNLGSETLPTDRPLLAARHLRRGGLLGVLVDQRVREGGLEVEFLGQPTLFADGPARLALAAGAPVVPAVIRREGDRRHRILVDPPLPMPSRKETGAVQRLTQAMAHALDRRIREAPTQWMWIHPRWEPVPPEPGARSSRRPVAAEAVR